jgi:hypothetical protein
LGLLGDDDYPVANQESELVIFWTRCFLYMELAYHMDAIYWNKFGATGKGVPHTILKQMWEWEVEICFSSLVFFPLSRSLEVDSSFNVLLLAVIDIA